MSHYFCTAVVLWSVLSALAPSQVPLASFPGAAGAARGRVIALLTDIDGDEVADFAEADPYFSHASLGFGTGRVSLFSGANGALLLSIDGQGAGERFGEVLCAADLDGDGRDELLIGAPLALGLSGKASGRIDALGLPLGNILWSREGVSARERYGSAIAVIGDWTGDRRPELAVGAPFSNQGGILSGRVEVLRSDGTPYGLTIAGANPSDRIGRVLAPAGDLNRDGWPELAVGQPAFNGAAGTATGRVVVYDRSGALISQIEGTAAFERLGRAIASLGDVNQDGFDDLLVASPGKDIGPKGSAGRVSLLLGPSLVPQWSAVGEEAGAGFGTTLLAAGDLDGDRITDVGVAAPFYDGAGCDRGALAFLSGADGSSLGMLLGTEDRGLFGFALSGPRDFDFDGRNDIAVAAPFGGDPAAPSGQINVYTIAPPLPLEITTLRTDAGPLRVRVADMDGDSDEDLVVLNATARTVQIFWNGDHGDLGPLVSRGIMDLIPSTRIAIPGTSPVESLEVAQLDLDQPREILVGHQFGALTVFDATSVGPVPSFVLTQSEVLIDDRPVVAPITAITAIRGAGLDQVVLVLGASLGSPSEIRLLHQPLTAPLTGATLAVGNAFSALRAQDLDLDGAIDLLVSDADLSSAGGARVLLGPTFSTVVQVPLPAGAAAVDLLAVDLDGNTDNDDLIVAATGFSGGQATVFRNFNPTGFAATSNAFSAPSLLRIARFDHRSSGFGLALTDGRGTLSLLSDWNGSSFDQEIGWPIGSGAVDIAAARLRQSSGLPACPGGDLVVAVAEDSVLRILRPRGLALVETIPGSGCPAPTLPTSLSVPTPPLLGNFAFRIELVDATPNAPALLIVVPIFPGQPSVALLPGPCTILDILTQPYLLLPDALGGTFTTSPVGQVLLPLPLVNEPTLCGAEFAMQWAVLDGGQFFGWTLSQATRIRIGEI